VHRPSVNKVKTIQRCLPVGPCDVSNLPTLPLGPCLLLPVVYTKASSSLLLLYRRLIIQLFVARITRRKLNALPRKVPPTKRRRVEDSQIEDPTPCNADYLSKVCKSVPTVYAAFSKIDNSRHWPAFRTMLKTKRREILNKFKP